MPNVKWESTAEDDVLSELRRCLGDNGIHDIKSKVGKMFTNAHRKGTPLNERLKALLSPTCFKGQHQPCNQSQLHDFGVKRNHKPKQTKKTHVFLYVGFCLPADPRFCSKKP